MRRVLTRIARPCLILAALLLPACEDGSTDPSALLVAKETEAALQVALDLPTLPALVGRVLDREQPAPAEVGSALQQARALWLEAEGASAADARRLRESAYTLAVPALTAALSEDQLLAVQDSLRQWIRIASSVSGIGALAGIAGALDEARVLLDNAARAEPTDHAAAVAGTLRAADRLLETTPRAVAQRLIAEAETRLAARGTTGTEDGVQVDRADRLVRGAKEAFRDREYLLAIRRAFYAGQLLPE